MLPSMSCKDSCLERDTGRHPLICSSAENIQFSSIWEVELQKREYRLTVLRSIQELLGKFSPSVTFPHLSQELHILKQYLIGQEKTVLDTVRRLSSHNNNSPLTQGNPLTSLSLCFCTLNWELFISTAATEMEVNPEQHPNALRGSRFQGAIFLITKLLFIISLNYFPLY